MRCVEFSMANDVLNPNPYLNCEICIWVSDINSSILGSIADCVECIHLWTLSPVALKCLDNKCYFIVIELKITSLKRVLYEGEKV